MNKIYSQCSWPKRLRCVIRDGDTIEQGFVFQVLKGIDVSDICISDFDDSMIAHHRVFILAAKSLC